MSEPRQTTWVAGEITGLDDERSIREGETAVERYHNSRDEARAQIMPMARGLLAAKRKYPATQEFGNCRIRPGTPGLRKTIAQH